MHDQPRLIELMNNHGCNPWKRTTNGAQDPLGGSNHESPRVHPSQRVNPGTMDYSWISRPAVAGRTYCIGLILNNGLTNQFF